MHLNINYGLLRGGTGKGRRWIGYIGCFARLWMLLRDRGMDVHHFLNEESLNQNRKITICF